MIDVRTKVTEDIAQMMLRWMTSFWTQNILSQKLIYEFQRCIMIVEEKKSLCIPFHYLNHVAFEAAGWIPWIPESKNLGMVAGSWVLGDLFEIQEIQWFCYPFFLSIFPLHFASQGDDV